MYLNLCYISLDGLRLSVKVVFPLRGVNLEIIYILLSTTEQFCFKNVTANCSAITIAIVKAEPSGLWLNQLMFILSTLCTYLEFIIRKLDNERSTPIFFLLYIMSQYFVQIWGSTNQKPYFLTTLTPW